MMRCALLILLLVTVTGCSVSLSCFVKGEEEVCTDGFDEHHKIVSNCQCTQKAAPAPTPTAPPSPAPTTVRR